MIMGENKLKIQYILLVILLIFGAYNTYNAYHKDYKLPYHHDEWQHTALSIQINEEDYNIQQDPYLGGQRYHKDFESGFHLFLASVSEFFDLDLIHTYQYFAAFFFLLSGLSIFLATSEITKKNLVGIVSLIIFIFLKTNVNILGKDFFVPITMTIPFIFVYILYFSNFLKQNKKSYLYLLGSILFVLLFVYPPSFLMLIFPSIFFAVTKFKSFKNKKLVYLLIPVFFIIFYLFWRNNFFDTLRYIFDVLYFEPGWGKLEIKYSIPFFYGLLNTFLALYGFYLSYKKKQLRFFLVFAFFSLTLTAIFNLFNFSVLIPYNRALHYAVIAMTPLSAIGFVELVEKYLKNKYVVYFFIVLFFVFSAFSQYPLDMRYKEYKEMVITEDAYQALLWIKENKGSDNILVSPYFMTSAVYPVSGNKVISIIPSQLSGGLIEENLNFFYFDCNKQKEIIEKGEADLVLSYSPVECEYAKIIFQNKGSYVYEIID